MMIVSVAEAGTTASSTAMSATQHASAIRRLSVFPHREASGVTGCGCFELGRVDANGDRLRIVIASGPLGFKICWKEKRGPQSSTLETNSGDGIVVLFPTFASEFVRHGEIKSGVKSTPVAQPPPPPANINVPFAHSRQ